ncbi:MAG: alpha/beta fold hydrolase [Chloroflexi bacterium]|nr:alpha/beta fold hydrolase [Chloroflexota bacterium]
MKARVNNIELGYAQQGQGQPVVFLHGFPLNKAMWERQVQALAGRYRAIAVDLRGHGESQVVEGPGSMEAFADDVRGLLDHLGIEQATLVGFSMGGYVAFAFYRTYASRVKALVLADTRPQPDTPEAAEGRRNTAKVVLESGSTAGVVDGMMPRMFTSVTLEGAPAVVERARGIMGSTVPQAVAADLLAMAGRPDSQPTLEQITCPTLVIVGDQDGLTPVADSELMASGIRGAKLVKVAGAAHLSPMEQPDAFTQALLGFLAQLP